MTLLQGMALVGVFAVVVLVAIVLWDKGNQR